MHPSAPPQWGLQSLVKSTLVHWNYEVFVSMELAQLLLYWRLECNQNNYSALCLVSLGLASCATDPGYQVDMGEKSDDLAGRDINIVATDGVRIVEGVHTAYISLVEREDTSLTIYPDSFTVVEPAVLIDASSVTPRDIEAVDAKTLCYRETGSAEGEEGEVNAHNEALGGLRRTSSKEDVLAALGKPEKVAGPEEEMATGDILWTWDYPSKGISIAISESSGPSALRLSSISMQAPSRLKTKLGIGIGSPLSEVLIVYKDCIADVSMNYDEETQLLVGSPYDGLWIAGTKGGNVTSLALDGAE